MRWVLIALFVICYVLGSEFRRFAIGFLAFFLLGVLYDAMHLFPNYLVNPIDTEALYRLEQLLFGITTEGGRLIPSEYFAIHHVAWVDFLCGIFYLGWVPVPVAFAFYLYLKKEYGWFLRFSFAFLLVNVLGFVGYYLHPAAPPWYVMAYGFEAVLSTAGNTAGLGRFDELLGIPVFHFIYGNNSNVFAAVPSLHSAYLPVVFYYAWLRKSSVGMLLVAGMFVCGIWFTAVYSSHHYVIDVLLGIGCAVAGILLLEKLLLRSKKLSGLLSRYIHSLS